MAELALPYSFRGVGGVVRVTVVANEEPTKLGCDLLDASLATDAATGFPVCLARPEIALEGYRATCGWIQVVKSTDTSGDFEMDPLTLFRDVDTPFAFFGLAPTLFDAPFRESRYDLAWQARAFLAAVPDGVMSKVVRPLAAFAWGFTVKAGVIDIEAPFALEAAAWDEQVPLMSEAHPTWRFETSTLA